jgi:hypothetical protein
MIKQMMDLEPEDLVEVDPMEMISPAVVLKTVTKEVDYLLWNPKNCSNSHVRIKSKIMMTLDQNSAQNWSITNMSLGYVLAIVGSQALHQCLVSVSIQKKHPFAERPLQIVRCPFSEES